MIFKIIQDNIHLLKAHNLDWEFFSPSDGAVTVLFGIDSMV